ncbi:MAG TPA: branched-chain amino acid ABC transporter permease [Nitrospirota bacterium]|nr:branched-chain amino acid ABC transporter permease [Nitrospirota bacterium]
MTLKKRMPWIVIIVIAVVAAIAVPFSASNYLLRVFNMTMITYMCVVSLFVIFGMAGQISFAQAGFWGVGAYITAILTVDLHTHPLLALIGSAVGTALLAIILGLALFRLHGHYFGFSTIGVVMILNGLFQNWKPVTGGADGIANIPPFRIASLAFVTETSIFYLIFFSAVVISVVTYLIHQSSLGRAFMAIRENEIAAKCMGVNSYRTKIIAFAISGIYCGIAGSLYSFMSSYISASSFTFPQSALYLVMLMLGGYHSLPGPIVGTTLLMLLPEWVRFLQEYILLIYGLGVMVLMVVMPDGLIGGGKKAYEFIRDKRGWVNADKKQPSTDIR